MFYIYKSRNVDLTDLSKPQNAFRSYLCSLDTLYKKPYLTESLDLL